uniref:Uncharacterized protein n=1 Tax=Ciona savignyi TaxID=51511 RepID=H2YRA8_CIOSA
MKITWILLMVVYSCCAVEYPAHNSEDSIESLGTGWLWNTTASCSPTCR